MDEPVNFKANVMHAILYSGITLYMLLIIVRWSGPWLQMDLDGPRWSWTRTAVEPLLRFLRRTLPSMGPTDWSPIIALLGLWFIRKLLTGI